MASANGAKSAKFCGIPPKSGTEASKKDNCIQYSSNFEKQWSEIKKKKIKSFNIVNFSQNCANNNVNTLKNQSIFQIVIFSMSECKAEEFQV